MSIHLDHCASTPVHPDVVEACARALRDLAGNPSSVHGAGSAARRALDRARDQVADLIGAVADEIVFTSGATEANHLALRVEIENGRRPGLAVSAIEHPSVVAAATQAEAGGASLRTLPVDDVGQIDEDALEVALAAGSGLISVQWANHETGVVQAIDHVAGRVHASAALIHVDAAQALGTLEIDLSRTPLDLLTGSGHKLNGPSGIGFLRVRRGLELAPIFGGGPQERGRRAGSPNLAGAIGLGLACEIAKRDRPVRVRQWSALRNRLRAGLREKIPGLHCTTPEVMSLPHVLHLSFDGVPGDWLVDALDGEGICVSSGAACASGARAPSPVLRAMGRDERRAREGVRMSIGLGVDEAQIDAVVNRLPDLVARAREVRP